MSSRHPGCGHGTAGLPSGTLEDVAASKAFPCLKPAVRTKQWAAEEGSYGKNRRPEGEIHRKEAWTETITSPARNSSANRLLPFQQNPGCRLLWAVCQQLQAAVMQLSGPNCTLPLYVTFPANTPRFTLKLIWHLSTPSVPIPPSPCF